MKKYGNNYHLKQVLLHVVTTAVVDDDGMTIIKKLQL